MKAIQQMKMLSGVHTVKLDFCMLGMTTKQRDGNKATARKRVTVMTNSGAIALLLKEAQCRSQHKFVPLLGGRAGPCQEYTEEV